MSRKISQVFQDFYDSEVKRAYGDVSKLSDKVYTSGKIVGKRVAFRKKQKAWQPNIFRVLMLQL